METIHAIDYSRRLELFETACNVFTVPIEGVELMVSDDTDLLAVYFDEESQEETPEGIPLIPGRGRDGILQETSTHPS